MLVLKDMWLVFEEDPKDNLPHDTKTIYEVKFQYNGVTDKGFEFSVTADVYKNVPMGYSIRNNLYQACDHVVHNIPVRKVIYLTYSEVEELYNGVREFYEKYVKDAETCYVQTIKSGGAGSEYK